MEQRIMATLADIQSAVAAQTTVVSEVAAAFKTAEAANDPVAMQAVVDSVNSNTAALTSAIQPVPPAA
jgi:hypothetical protein